MRVSILKIMFRPLHWVKGRGSHKELSKPGCLTGANHWTTPCLLDLDPYSSIVDEEDKSSEISRISLVKAPVGLADEEDKSLDISHISLVRVAVGLLKRKLLILDLNGLLADIFNIVELDPNYKPDFTFGNESRTWACEK